MPFLRLTRDRRGYERTLLLHAERPGDKPRLLYWYRTAPDIGMGRSPLDEEAIRTIEEQHPGIEFDWPAILAMSEVMTPEEEQAPTRPPPRRKPRTREPYAADERRQEPEPGGESVAESLPAGDDVADSTVESPPPAVPGLLEELVGREIASRLRARYADIRSRIDTRPADDERRQPWLARAASIDPDRWLTPEAILEGIARADAAYDALRRELAW